MAAATLLVNLGTGRLGDWDEAIYAEVAREIGVTGDWVVMHWNLGPFNDKPPLLFWLTALSYGLFGIDEFAARLPSALAGVATVVAVYAVARHHTGRLGAVLAGLVLLLCIQWTAGARHGTTDALLTLCFWVAVLGYLNAERDRRWWYLAGGAAGLAILTKGAGGLLVVGILGLALLADRRWGELRSRHLWLAAGLGLAVMLPWHLAALARQGPLFLDQYLGYHVLARAAEPIEGHRGSGLLTYVAYMRNQFFPWFYLAPFGVFLLARQRGRSWIVLLLPAAVLAVYTAVRTKWLWYMLPAYPALAIMCGALLESALLRRDRLALAGLGLAALAALLSVPAILTPYPRWWALPFLALALAALAVRPARRLGAAAPAAFLALVSLHYVAALYPAERPWYVAPVRAQVVPLAIAAGRDDPGRPLLVYVGSGGAVVDTPVWPDVLFYSRRPLREIREPAPGEVILAQPDAERLRVQPIASSGPFVYGRLVAP